jgi:hypothetical protein
MCSITDNKTAVANTFLNTIITGILLLSTQKSFSIERIEGFRLDAVTGTLNGGYANA